jgi:hypothetical protein
VAWPGQVRLKVLRRLGEPGPLRRLPWVEARAFWQRAAEVAEQQLAAEAERMSAGPAHWRPVVWAMEPATLAVAELGRYRVWARVVSLRAEAPTSVAARAG